MLKLKVILKVDFKVEFKVIIDIPLHLIFNFKININKLKNQYIDSINLKINISI